MNARVVTRDESRALAMQNDDDDASIKFAYPIPHRIRCPATKKKNRVIFMCSRDATCGVRSSTIQ